MQTSINFDSDYRDKLSETQADTIIEEDDTESFKEVATIEKTEKDESPGKCSRFLKSISLG
jgi:hypothetical protein